MEAVVPRVCLVGPLVGRHVGNATMQAEKLADLLTAAGYPVRAFSSQVNPYLRLADITTSLLRHGPHIDVTLLEVYGGRSFVIEDVASCLARRFGHRLVMTLHGGALPEFLARYPRWARQVLDRADALVAPSEFLARMARSQGRAVEIIPNVVDIGAYPYRHRQVLSPRIWWMRSFHEIYNPALALRVLRRVRARGHDATLVMSGPNKGLEPEIKSLARQLELEPFVRFAGFLDMAGKAHEGSLADIYLNTSRIDNAPVALVEACAMGLPIVTTNVGGIPDLFQDGRTALLVRGDDDAALAAAVDRLLAQPDLAGRLSENGRALAEQASWPQVRPRWERMIGLPGAVSA